MVLRFIAVFSVLALGLAGCSTLSSKFFALPSYEQSDRSRLHHIGSDLYGAYQPYMQSEQAQRLAYLSPWVKNGPTAETLRNRNAPLFEAYQGLLEDIKANMRSFIVEDRNSRKKTLRIMLLLHGGLNHPKHGTDKLEKHMNLFVEERIYPLVVSWRSGIFVSAADRYSNVRNGRSAVGPLAPLRGIFYGVSDILSGVAKLPETLWDQGANFLERQSQVSMSGPDRDRNDYVEDYFCRDSHSGIWETGKPHSSLAETVYRTKQVIPGVVRIVTTPLAQGLGQPAWQMMYRRAKHLTKMEADSLSINTSYCGEKCDPRGNGVLAVLAKNLILLQEELSMEAVDLEIMLVGHSMGAIAANDIISEYPTLPINSLIHMASADSVRSWQEKVQPWLESKGKAVNFYNLVLHPTNEEREDISKFSAVPEGSLLVWLDEMLTTPETILERRSGRWRNAKHLLPTYKVLKNAHLKVFPLNRVHSPATHGDFDEFTFWKPHFYWRGEEKYSLSSLESDCQLGGNASQVPSQDDGAQ